MLSPHRSGSFVALCMVAMLVLTLPAAAQTAATGPATAPSNVSAKVGSFQARFDKHPAIASIPVVFSRCLTGPGIKYALDAIKAHNPKNVGRKTYVNLETASCEIYVPEDYDPKVPHGLFVWISSAADGKPIASWLKGFKQRRIIFVGLNDAGNPVDPPTMRIPLALYGYSYAVDHYNIDPQRVYVSGVSGGGRCASWVATSYADIFSGGFYMVGCNGFPEKMPTPPPSVLKVMQAQNRYVFFTGDKDANLKDTQSVLKMYQQQGVRQSLYLQKPAGGHEAAQGEWFDKGMDFLDAPLLAALPKLMENAKKQETTKRGEAIETYSLVLGRAQDAEMAREARTRLDALQTAYDADAAALKKLIEDKSFAPAAQALQKFKTTWKPHGDQDADALTAALSAARSGKAK